MYIAWILIVINEVLALKFLHTVKKYICIFKKKQEQKKRRALKTFLFRSSFSLQWIIVKFISLYRICLNQKSNNYVSMYVESNYSLKTNTSQSILSMQNFICRSTKIGPPIFSSTQPQLHGILLTYKNLVCVTHTQPYRTNGIQKQNHFYLLTNLVRRLILFH